MEKISLRITHYALRILLVATVLLTSTQALAATHEQIMEGVDLTTIKRLAIAYPNHYKAEMISDEPTIEALIEMLNTASKAKNFYVVPYYEVVESIKSDAGVDITTLNFRDAKATFEDNVGTYADAFVTLTTANNDDPTTFLFKIQNARTGQLMYTLQINSRIFGKNAKGYNGACETFYKTLDMAIDKQAKKK